MRDCPRSFGCGYAALCLLCLFAARNGKPTEANEVNEAGADATKALWQLAQLKHQVLQRRVAAVGQQRRQNIRDLLVGREAPDEPVGGTFVLPKRDTATYPKAMADAQARR
jgi:hypothetical protein